jgi:hypothetical protein
LRRDQKNYSRSCHEEHIKKKKPRSSKLAHRKTIKIAEERRGRTEKKQVSAFQREARKDKEHFIIERCRDLEEKNRNKRLIRQLKSSLDTPSPKQNRRDV